MNFVEAILQINPNNRPPASVICEQLKEFASSKNINPKSPLSIANKSSSELQPNLIDKDTFVEDTSGKKLIDFS